MTVAVEVGLGSPPGEEGWTVPVGIPDPPAMMLEALPTLPSPWTSNQTGFYYVKEGGTNPNEGYPSSPRGTIPVAPAAGSVIVLDNTVAYTEPNDYEIDFQGTSGARCWLVSSGSVGLTAAGQATFQHGHALFVIGSYFTCDGIDFFCNGTNGGDGFWLGIDGTWNTDEATYACVRNGTIRGNGQERLSNAGNGIHGADHVVVYNCVIRDQGDWDRTGAGDIDCPGFAGFYGADIWILDCTFYHNQGDGIQINGGGESGSQTNTDEVQRVYVGGCLFYENHQTGCWIKNGRDIIISQNESWGHGVLPANLRDAPIEMGIQYGGHRVWWLYNYLHDGCTGIGVSSSNDGGFARELYAIGNIIDTMVGDAGANSEGFHLWGTWDKLYVIHNTIYGYEWGFTANAGANACDVRLENNIFWSRNNGSDYDVETEYSSVPPKVKNNIFPASPRFFIDSSQTLSIAAMEAEDATNRSGNGTADPQFADAAGGDFHIGASSSALDNGDPVTDVYATFQALYGRSIGVDYYRTARPVGAHWDRGAVERT